MTKHELSQLYYLKREIELLQVRIEELETAATKCTSVITGMPHAGGTGDKVGKYAVEIAELRNLLSLNLQKCWYELSRLNRYIAEIEDSRMRQILTYRYVQGMTWHQVAISIGEYEESYVRRKHNKFLSESEKTCRKCQMIS